MRLQPGIFFLAEKRCPVYPLLTATKTPTSKVRKYLVDAFAEPQT